MAKTLVYEKFAAIFGASLDFLFPKEKSVNPFEETPATELARALPASTAFKSADGTIRVQSLFSYADERVKHLVWEIKYYKNRKIAEHAGKLLAEKIKQALPTRMKSEHFLVVPIPLTNKRRKERGFHHTKLIAESTLKFLPENFSLALNILEKIKNTPKQSSIENRAERFENIRGVFTVPNQESIQSKNIILVDDVVTTGATMAEASLVLLSSGAANVFTFAIAH